MVRQQYSRSDLHSRSVDGATLYSLCSDLTICHLNLTSWRNVLCAPTASAVAIPDLVDVYVPMNTSGEPDEKVAGTCSFCVECTVLSED